MPNKDNREVDIFTVFTGINNLFVGLKKIVKNISIALFKFLLFTIESIWKYKIVVIGSAIVFGAYGFYLKQNAQKIYINTMLVETNYSSSIQLYRVIDNLNNLSALNDTTTLVQELNNAGISPNSLKSFSVEHYSSLNETSKLINEYLLNMDEALREVISMEEIRNKIKSTEYKKHVITVEATENSVFKPLQKSIINAVRNSEYLTRKHENFIANYNIQKTNNDVTLKQLEALKVLYEYEIETQAEKKKQVISSSAVMFAPEQDNIDREAPLKVITKIMSIQDINQEIDLERQENNEIINIISGFDRVGKLKPMTNNFNLTTGFILGVAISLLLSLIPLIKEWRETL